ncbi:hypothetical protein E2C01_053807 [Portunus trituberculatus]|uniref:Uncharacterized protein n=1 Tax=Portunus trituberculatus TaxID=210409 RepID=A0A5B7GHQ1_PORTR|nr:hypothetical protein [Portunus trituberculatus]
MKASGPAGNWLQTRHTEGRHFYRAVESLVHIGSCLGLRQSQFFQHGLMAATEARHSCPSDQSPDRPVSRGGPDHAPSRCQTNSLIPRLTLADQPRGKGGAAADSGLNNKRGSSITPCGTSAYLVIKSRPEGDSPLFVAARGRQAGTPHPDASHAADPHLVNTCSAFLIKVEGSHTRSERNSCRSEPTGRP